MAGLTRTINPLRPAELGTHQGLSYSLWMPDASGSLAGGVTIVHGARSCKENHHDFARACVAAGVAALAFDIRGHGTSGGPMDGRILGDVAEMAALLRSRTAREDLPVALRGTSLGGYLAILAAPVASAAAVVAICPASDEILRRSLGSYRLDSGVDHQALEGLVSEHELYRAVEALEAPLLLLHAEGDEAVPVGHSRELARRVRAAGSRLITVPGGHHRSVQHDPELQAVSLRWIKQCFRTRSATAENRGRRAAQ